MANIKDQFPEFFQSKLEVNDLESKANNLIVLDTNFLLDIIQMPTDIAKTYVEALEKVKDNLYIPYLVALEFNFRKSGIKKEKHHNINKYKDDVKKTIDSLKKNILNYNLINIKEKTEVFSKELIEEVDNFQIKILDMLDKKVANAITEEENSLYENLINIIEDRIGEKYTDDWIKSVENEGEDRYKSQIPPGFNDTSKEKQDEGSRRYGDILYHRKFGDLIIWKDIIKYSSENESKGSKVIYITNDGQSDKKKDLLYKVNNLIVGPHISLMNELQLEARKELYILSNFRFVQLVSNLSDDQLREMEKLSTVWNDSSLIESSKEYPSYRDKIKMLHKIYNSKSTNDFERNPFVEDSERDEIEKERFIERLERNPFTEDSKRDEIEKERFIERLEKERFMERLEKERFIERLEKEQLEKEHYMEMLVEERRRDEIEQLKIEEELNNHYSSNEYYNR